MIYLEGRTENLFGKISTGIGPAIKFDLAKYLVNDEFSIVFLKRRLQFFNVFRNSVTKPARTNAPHS